MAMHDEEASGLQPHTEVAEAQGLSDEASMAKAEKWRRRRKAKKLKKKTALAAEAVTSAMD